MLIKRLKLFLNPFNDGRYEDLTKGKVVLNVLRDATAGLIVAMVAIPLAMGFAMASGLRPEQGIVGGAVAGLVGALFGGSKYQVYGPTAAYIPIIAAIMTAYDHRFLVLAAIVAGIMLMIMGLGGLGKYVNMVPHSIVVGFTIGIAVTIGLSQVGEVFGFANALPYKFAGKVSGIVDQFGALKIWAFILAIGTLVLTKVLLRISFFIPAPLIALAVGTVLSMTVLADESLALIRTKYGSIPARSWSFTPPVAQAMDAKYFGDVVYYAIAIVFVAAIESLLCSRMADRLANNRGTKFFPEKELWGQGLVNILVPLFNGFPHTGALARTATNIKLGAVSPLSGIFKFAFKLVLAFYLASYLELVPMACIGGILMYVALNMVKPEEVKEVLSMGRVHVALMFYTAIAVIVTDFLTGVLTAIAIYVFVRPKEEKVHAVAELAHVPTAAEAPNVRAVLGKGRAAARRHSHEAMVPVERQTWLAHIRHRAHIARSAFVHAQATVIGRVVLGEHVHIAAGTSVRADEGAPFFIGEGSNLQDGVVVHALKDKYVRIDGEDWAVYVGRDVSIAHNALVHGPCYIGDHTFVGFKAVVHDAIVGSRCFIGIGSTVVGVEIPDGTFVPHGTLVDTPEKVRALPPASETHRAFNKDVVEVNRGLAAAYREYRHQGVAHTAVRVSVDSGWEPPMTSWDDRF
jgi:MFS superfamily sulfate permease-like transporter/carbonic anhydrase/acetyltransferase-like protein (isoleucine patch superfamily)